MKTLVLGASGFIGSAFLKQDLKDNIEIVTRNNSLNVTKYKAHIGDIKDKDFLKNLAKLEFEKVINFSWEGLPDISERNNKINLEVQLNVIKTFADSGTKQFDIAGSCLEYGSFEGKASEVEIGRDLTDFAKTKLQLLDFLQTQSLMHRWFRLFYVYGPKQHNKSLLASAYLSAKRGTMLQVSNPNISRDFIYVDDVASAIDKLTSNLSAQGVFNIGSGAPTAITQMVSRVYAHFGLDFDVLKTDQNRSLIADTTRIKKISDWNHVYTIENGIDQYIKWANQADFS
jgi:nucleoside-diphosphate-sugar epimerase